MPGTADGGHQAGHKSHLGSSPHRAHSGVHGTRARGRALQRGRSPHRHGEPGSDGAGYTGWSRRNATEATPGRAELSTQLSTAPAAALGGRGRGPARHHADGRRVPASSPCVGRTLREQNWPSPQAAPSESRADRGGLFLPPQTPLLEPHWMERESRSGNRPRGTSSREPCGPPGSA